MATDTSDATCVKAVMQASTASRLLELKGYDGDASRTAALGMLIADLQSERNILAKKLTWQPIDTAPRSYQPPLSHVNHHAPEILGLYGKSFYCVCKWGGPSRPYWIDGENRRVSFQPTHWMALPEAA